MVSIMQSDLTGRYAIVLFTILLSQSCGFHRNSSEDIERYKLMQRVELFCIIHLNAENHLPLGTLFGPAFRMEGMTYDEINRTWRYRIGDDRFFYTDTVPSSARIGSNQMILAVIGSAEWTEGGGHDYPYWVIMLDPKGIEMQVVLEKLVTNSMPRPGQIFPIRKGTGKVKVKYTENSPGGTSDATRRA
jgi:hypothetical protein